MNYYMKITIKNLNKINKNIDILQNIHSFNKSVNISMLTNV